MKLSPAEYVVLVFGGQTATAKALRRGQATICQWLNSRQRGGTGGFIPSPAQQMILKVAKKRGLDIQPADLVVGREIKQVDLRERNEKKSKKD